MTSVTADERAEHERIRERYRHVMRELADLRAENARYKAALDEVWRIATEGNWQCRHPEEWSDSEDSNETTCCGDDCIYCAVLNTISAALSPDPERPQLSGSFTRPPRDRVVDIRSPEARLRLLEAIQENPKAGFYDPEKPQPVVGSGEK